MTDHTTDPSNSGSSSSFMLPAAPPELCFDKNEFSMKSFSVDEFLHEHRNDAGLEAMRDGLGTYLKVLRSAMIELINEDYADFVNLSSNLIGLDHSIDGIRTPLVQLQDEITAVQASLAETMRELSDCLQTKKTLRTHLRSIHALTRVHQSVQKLDELLNGSSGGGNEMSITAGATLLERAAMEYVQIDFELQFCRHLLRAPPVDGEMIDRLHRQLLRMLEDHFLTVLAERNVDRLERCLRIYCTLDACRMAEDIFRLKIVAPHMHPIIAESTLHGGGGGLQTIYDQLLSFVETKMDQLLTLTTAKTTKPVKGFDFLLNSYWTEIERRLETHMASIFAPGNPDLFWQKFEQSNAFLLALEAFELNFAEKLRQHEQYKRFQMRWNLPVYFQIRFQEIGGMLETACSKPPQMPTEGNTTAVRLLPIRTAIECITKCWSTGVFLPQIFHRFWKLTLQCVARTSAWASECLAITRWDESKNGSIVDFFVCLSGDIDYMRTKYLDDILAMAVRNAPPNVRPHRMWLEQCLQESRTSLSDRRREVRARIVQEVLAKCSPNILQVNDIPRLFRKTNRDVPSKPCAYLDAVLDPVRQFNGKYGQSIDRIDELLVPIFESLNDRYHKAVDEVLTSVQRTEESLRRLKNLRNEKSSSGVSSGSNLGGGGGMTDDDKIRLQLQVDVLHWQEQISILGIPTPAKLAALLKLVEDFTKLRVTNKQ